MTTTQQTIAHARDVAEFGEFWAREIKTPKDRVRVRRRLQVMARYQGSPEKAEVKKLLEAIAKAMAEAGEFLDRHQDDCRCPLCKSIEEAHFDDTKAYLRRALEAVHFVCNNASSMIETEIL